jgi:hypothetical protein
MPGNRFGVGELWDGVKQAVTDAFNTVAQTFTGKLKELFGLATKYLPQINLIVKTVAYLPGLINAVGDGVKNLPRAFESTGRAIQTTISNVQKTISGAVLGALRTTEKALKSAFNAAIKPLPKNIQAGMKATFKPLFDGLKNSAKDTLKQFNKLPSTIVKGVKAPIDALGKLIRTDIGKIPKLIESKVTGIVKAVQKVPGDIGKLFQKFSTDVTKTVQKIPADVGKNFDAKVKDINKNFTEALKRFDKAADDIAAKTLQPIKAVQKGVDDAGKAITKVAQDTVKGVGSKVDESAKSITRSFGEANKRFDDALKTVGKQSGQALEELKLLPKRAAEQVAKEVQVVTKEVTRAGQETAKVVGKNVDDMGKSVGKIAQQADETAKVVAKVAPFLDDIVKIALNAAPIIDGFADYMQFEELKLLLETIQEKQKNDFETVVSTQVTTARLLSKIERIEARLGTGNVTPANVDLSPVLNAIDALPKTGGIASSAEIAAAVVAKMPKTDTLAIADAVAAKVPKPDTIAIAEAVAAKVPKPIDNTATLTKVIQDSIKAVPPGQTVSSEAIATAVAAKIPKPLDNNGLAAVVKTAMAPSLQAIDAKLPDNGIYRVDQAGIANAVAGKLEKDSAATGGAIAEILKGVRGIPALTKEQNALITKAINDAKPAIPKDIATTGGLNQVVNLVNNHTSNQTRNTINTVQNIRVSVPAAPATDLSPLDTQLKEISKAIGVDQLKSATPVNAEQLVKQAGLQQFAGGSVQGVTTLAGLMAAFAAPQFFRSGSHRLGGTFDQSVMNPKAGKVQIDDAMGFQQWQFRQIDERLGLPSEMQVVSKTGAIQKQQFRNIQDSVEEINGVIVGNAQDLEIIERYLFALTQDLQKLMQIALQTREDVDVLIDDAGCKTIEVRRSHPTHLKLSAPGQASSLTDLFQQGQVHYVAKVWDDKADKNQQLQRMSYDTQIAAMSNKFELDKTNVELPLDKSRATDKPRNDEVWRTFVSTVEAPPEGYVTPGNPRPKIQEIKNGNPSNVPLPTDPLKKLGK